MTSEIKDGDSSIRIEVTIEETDPNISNSYDNDNDSIGSADDLLTDPNNNKQVETGGANFIKDKLLLGFNLPSNDVAKSGQLDTMSVDSYWVDDEDIDQIEEEKRIDPVNPDYKSVYEKTVQKHRQETEGKKN
jgi:hypothetical protein